MPRAAIYARDQVTSLETQIEGTSAVLTGYGVQDFDI